MRLDVHNPWRKNRLNGRHWINYVQKSWNAWNDAGHKMTECGNSILWPQLKGRSMLTITNFLLLFRTQNRQTMPQLTDCVKSAPQFIIRYRTWTRLVMLWIKNVLFPSSTNTNIWNVPIARDIAASYKYHQLLKEAIGEMAELVKNMKLECSLKVAVDADIGLREMLLLLNVQAKETLSSRMRQKMNTVSHKIK